MWKILALISFPLSLFAQAGSANGTFTDNRDGSTYRWIRIGNQVWMAENLRYHPNTGSFLYSYKSEYEQLYGRLYTWDIASKSCPDGWHLPEGWEISELYDQFGGMKLAGAALKESGTKHWTTPNSSANNRSGFTALPAGAYSGKLYLQFNSIGKQAYFWTSTEVGGSTARVMQLGYNHTAAYDLGYHPKTWALSVRCLKNKP